MSDDDFGDLDFGDSQKSDFADKELPDYDENREFHDVSSQVMKKLGNSKNVLTQNHTRNLEFLEPRNKFEEILKEHNARICYDDHEMEHCVVLENSVNHTEFTKSLETKMSSGRGSNSVFEEFSAACAKNFELYISPTKSKFGIQDTVFRAFLLAKPSQKYAFELLLQNLNQLARKSDEKSINLARICVGHMRSLDRIFEPASIFNLIFHFPFKIWNSEVRDLLISVLPEILGDFTQQQETAKTLNDIILETEKIQGDVKEFQMTILETLKLLRMEQSVARIIRRNICHNCMHFDVSCLPALVSFALETLLISSSSNSLKNDEEEAIFHEMIQDFSKFLKIEKLGAEADSIVTEVFSHFLRYLQLEKKGWKHITTFINRKMDTFPVKEEVEAEGEEGDDREEEVVVQWNQNPFEVMLILSLLSSECCPPSLTSAVNSKILNLAAGPASAISKFLKIIDHVMGFRKFSIANLPSLTHVARQCLWSPEATIRQLGTNVYKTLLIGMENKQREQVFSELMKHFTQSDTECDSVLDVFFKVIRSNPDVLMEFGSEIQESVGSILKLTTENVKKLFQVMILMSKHGGKDGFEMDTLIEIFLASCSEKKKFLGILALVMNIQCEMVKKHSEAQEMAIQESLTRIEEASENSAVLRGAFFEHFTEVVQNHKRTEEIRCVSRYLEKILEKFKKDFFEEVDDEEMTTKLVLKPEEERYLEVVPMFNLIKELCVLRNRWREEDDDSMRSSYDVNILQELNFTFESSIFIHSQNSEDVTRNQKMKQLFFAIQWCRSVLNAFFGQSSIDFLESENVAKCSVKIFYQMMECEKKLLQNLKNLGAWSIPNLKFEDLEVRGAAKKSKTKKRRTEEGGEEESEGGVEKDPSLEANLREFYVPLKLRPVAHLLQLARTKRSCLIYLCDELQNVLQDLTKMKAKKALSGFLASRQTTPSQTKKIDKFYHGDSVTIWSSIKKSIDEIWGIIENVFEFFANAANNSSQEIGEKLEKDMENLAEKCLKILNSILGSELFGTPDEKLSNSEKSEKKNVILMILERKILNADGLSKNPESAKIEVARFLLKNAENAATPQIAMLILETFENLKMQDEEIRRNMVKYALSYLKKDWSSCEEGKGAKFNAAARDILKHCISLRKEKEQIPAIKWLLTNKVVKLVPEDDRRQSTVLSTQSDDILMSKDDGNSAFYCINKSTFGFIFKTLFSMLNTCVTRKELTAQAVKNGQISEEDTLTHWENASSCFLILCMLLRFNKIRTVNVLYTAIKEGKQFLVNVSRKSSFIYLVDNITTGSNFAVISTKIERIMSAVQNGNRVLQSIGTYAKTSKCVNLLKKYPELRAESENCLRIIHSAMVKNECLDAFTVGRLKSRDIDGGIILERQESAPASDEE